MDRATENFHSFVEALVSGKPILRAGLDKQDVREEISRDDQTIIANGLCKQFPEILSGVRALVTWSPDERSFACESRDETIARLAGYSAFGSDQADRDDFDSEVIWWGTRPTSTGTFVAQFQIVGRE